MRSAVVACIAEWRRMISDPGAMLILVGALVVYALFYPQPYVPEVLKEVPTIVVDHDGTPLSRQLARMVDNSELVWVVDRTPEKAAATAAVRRGRAGAILEIPRGFERDVLRGDAVTIGCFADAAYFLVYRQAMTGLLGAARTLSAGIEISRLEAAGMTPDAARIARAPLTVEDRPLFNPAEGYASYIVPAVLVLIMQQTLLIGIGMLSGTTKERGGREPGMGSLTALIGRALAYLILYYVHAVFYFVVVRWVFGLPYRGDLTTSLVFALPFLLAAILLALTVSSMFRERETALQVLLFTSIPALFLAGFSWPSEMIPGWLRTTAQLLPSSSAIEGFLRINQMGASIADVATEWRTLWCLCGAYLLTAWWSHSRRTMISALPDERP